MCPTDKLWARLYRPTSAFFVLRLHLCKDPVHQIFMNPVIRNVYSVFLPDKDFQHLGAISELLVCLIYCCGFFHCDRFFRSSDRLPDYRNCSSIPISLPELIPASPCYVLNLRYHFGWLCLFLLKDYQLNLLLLGQLYRWVRVELNFWYRK